MHTLLQQSYLAIVAVREYSLQLLSDLDGPCVILTNGMPHQTMVIKKWNCFFVHFLILMGLMQNLGDHMVKMVEPEDGKSLGF